MSEERACGPPPSAADATPHSTCALLMRQYRTSLGRQMAQSSSLGLPEFLKSNQLCTILGFNEWSMSEIDSMTMSAPRSK
jgi:hypothetical protein